MQRLFKYLPFHFLVLIILGIVIQYYSGFWKIEVVKTFTLLLCLILCLFIIKNKIARTLISFFVFFLLGVAAVFINDDRNYDNFYSSYLKENSSTVLVIKKVLKPAIYYYKYEAEVVKVDKQKTKGKILLNIKKDSVNSTLKVGSHVFISTPFQNLIPPLNPHQFNYKSYLSKQGIHYQVFVEQNQLLKLKSASYSLIVISAKVRSFIQKSLKKYAFSKDEFAVINALLLGQRQDISKELITDYSRAGAIHILAVSGLHVGIILLILSFLLKPIEILKNGKVFKIILIVLFLWMFAFVAGLSASVVRAVTMFTFLAVGQTFQRKNVVYFSLISSMFFLLIIKPMFLFDVGFQLSYLAVFGIVWIQPKLYAIWKPKFKVVDFFWKLFTVSIAAQVGILPLSIYYFHQFPGLFIISNLVIIPFLGFILLGGIIVICLAVLDILPQVLANIYGTIISWMNDFIRLISHQEEFLLKDLYLSFLLMVASYFVIFSGLHFLIEKKAKKFLSFLCFVIFAQSVFLIEDYYKTEKKEFIVFHKSRKSIIGNRVGKTLYLKHNLDSLFFKENSIHQYKLAEGIEKVASSSFKQVLRFNNTTILLVDSLGVYKIKKLFSPIVILQYSPKINLRRLIKELKPCKIIADGSNYKSYVNRWQLISKEENVFFHYTGEKGAFILR